MDEREAFKLLTLASARDGRTVSRATAQVWATDLSEIDFIEATEALTVHFRQSAGWLLPVHVIEGVKRIRNERRAAEDRRLTVAERTQRDEERERETLERLGVTT